VLAAGCVFDAGEALVSTVPPEGASVLPAGTAPVLAGASLAGDAETVGCAVGCGEGFVPAGTLSSTERVPVNAGNDKTMASNMNAAAAPMAIFANSVWVPRGPKAVLEIEFVKSAPASALPGWSNTATISTTHAMTKTVYSKINN